jgi:hypothetical protein
MEIQTVHLFSPEVVITLLLIISIASLRLIGINISVREYIVFWLLLFAVYVLRNIIFFGRLFL